MMMTYYLAWLHFDSSGRMSTRLPDGHRVLEVLVTSSSNRHPPALWVLVEAVVATPSYTPAAGFPLPAEVPAEYQQQAPRQTPVGGHPSMPIPVPYPVPSRAEQYDYREATGAGQQGTGRTTYPELYQEARDDDYRNDTYVPDVPMSPSASRK